MASTSPSSQPTSYRQFYVFLSHRGPDVKNTLASHIYHALDRYEVSVFQDKYEMERGEQIPAQIEDVIRNASFHIPIFSKGYVDSRWCLDELCSIMETPAKILPVFYDVEPSDLSSRDGLYAKALQTLGEQKRNGGTPKYDSQTIQKWQKALSEVRNRSGLELKAFNGDEGLLVKNIVHEVLEHVKSTPLPHDEADVKRRYETL